MQRVEIRSVKGNQSRTEILIDGHKIDGVRSYEIKQIAGYYPILSIDAINISVDKPMVIMNSQLNEEMQIMFPNEKEPAE